MKVMIRKEAEREASGKPTSNISWHGRQVNAQKLKRFRQRNPVEASMLSPEAGMLIFLKFNMRRRFALKGSDMNRITQYI
jgi:hypothetical protein